MTKASAETHRSALTWVWGWKWARFIPTCHWELLVCLLYSPETRNAAFALPFHCRTVDGCVSASSRSTCMQRHSSSAALCAVSLWRLWARNEGAVSGTPHQSSRERFAFQSHRRLRHCCLNVTYFVKIWTTDYVQLLRRMRPSAVP